MDALELYIRTGQVTPQLEKSDGGYAIPDDWFGSEPLPAGADSFDLYAMPAATAMLLEDKKVNIRDFIVSDTMKGWGEHALPGFEARGPARILRDPYSARPYVLFYITAKAFRRPAVAA